jgi:2-iminobutanoate/2-iminopropanoate deaminase
MIRRPRLLVLAAACAVALPGCAIFSPGEPPLIPIVEAPRLPGAYARSTVYGGMLFTAGVFPSDRVTGTVMHGDIAAQTNRVFDNLEAILAGAGCNLEDLVKVDIRVTEFADLAKMNDVIAARLHGSSPARTTVPGARLGGFALLEVDFVARVPRQRD